MSRKRKTPSRNPQRFLPTLGGPNGARQDKSKVFIKGKHIGWLGRTRHGDFHWSSTTDWDGYGEAPWKKDALRDIAQAWTKHCAANASAGDLEGVVACR